MPLEKETAIFESHRTEWCKSDKGKFAVIQDETILDSFFDEWEDGLRAGFKQFGAERPFLIKEILETDRVYFVG